MRDSTPSANDVLVHVSPQLDGDEEELAEAVMMLREELLELDVRAAEPLLEENAPESSKGALAAVGGWLAVTLGAEALRLVVNRVVSWAARSNSTVEISLGGDVLKVTGLDRDQQNRLIDEWLARQAAST